MKAYNSLFHICVKIYAQLFMSKYIATNMAKTISVKLQMLLEQ